MEQHDRAFRERLSADEEVLAKIECDLVDAVRVRDEAQQQMNVLQRTIAQAISHINDLTTRRDLLKKSIEQRHAAPLLRPLPTFPNELLGMIFMNTIDHLNRARDRTKQPFRCAAVCRRWRSVALDVSDLWTHIDVPLLRAEKAGGFWLGTVQRLLFRSRACALHITVSLADDEGAFRFYRPIFSSLLLHCARWRVFDLHGDFFDITHLEIFDLLRRRTPLLESVTLAFNGQYNLRWPDQSPACLPYAPRLRYVRLANVPIPFARTPDNDDGAMMLPATSLALREDDYVFERFAATLASFPALTTLELVCGECDSWPVSSPRIPLPELRKLIITYQDVEGGTDVDYDTFRHILDTLDLPRLRILEVAPHLLEDAEGLIRRCATTVEELHLSEGYLDHGNYATALEPLHELRQISFNSVEISSYFLIALRDMATPVWPKLERLVLSGMRFCNPRGLLDFLYGRYPTDTAGPWSCALLEVDVDDSFLDGSAVAAEIRLLLENEQARRDAEK